MEATKIETEDGTNPIQAYADACERYARADKDKKATKAAIFASMDKVMSDYIQIGDLKAKRWPKVGKSLDTDKVKLFLADHLDEYLKETLAIMLDVL